MNIYIYILYFKISIYYSTIQIKKLKLYIYCLFGFINFNFNNENTFSDTVSFML